MSLFGKCGRDANIYIYIYIHGCRTCEVRGVCASLSSPLLAWMLWSMSSFRVSHVWHCLLVFVPIDSGALIVYVRLFDEYGFSLRSFYERVRI